MQPLRNARRRQSRLDILPHYTPGESEVDIQNSGTAWRRMSMQASAFDTDKTIKEDDHFVRMLYYVDVKPNTVALLQMNFRHKQRDFLISLVPTKHVDYRGPLLSRIDPSSRRDLVQSLVEFGIVQGYATEYMQVIEHPSDFRSFTLLVSAEGIHDALTLVERLMTYLGSEPSMLLQDMQKKVDHVLKEMEQEGLLDVAMCRNRPAR